MPETSPSPDPAARPSLADTAVLSGTAMLLGGLAGAVAAITYLTMLAVQHTIWEVAGPSRWMILPITLAGGVIIGWAQSRSAGPELETQLAAARNPELIHRRESLLLALTAVVAVGFGGAVGPEAGIMALTSQLSAIVALKLGRKAAEQRMLTEAGTSGALAGFYGSPAGGPLHSVPEGEMPRPVLFLAGFAGLMGFMWTAEFLREDALGALWLPRLRADTGRWDAFIALLPGLAGALAGAVFLAALAAIRAALERWLPNRFWQPVAGGLVLGLLCIPLPVLLFSGHDSITDMLRLGRDGAIGLMLALGFGKALACAVCIGSRWKGGVIFPMCFSGGAFGAATLALLPGLDPVLGVAAGMAGASAVGMTRPVVAGIVMVFVLGPGLAVPVIVGSFIGWYLLRLLPPQLREVAL